eukprot:CAMPEP_0169301146 /NCGR_PEP_ID=MMETSP1016-20121227/68071_1 /TAXON_ID=342587 /ORGANISM="Karlodinium micrum, Strain CCMP2283" /LENGTH=49 /DNA_ID= /DNA_START= /DNA_END= /DNA_ORIENTATION=
MTSCSTKGWQLNGQSLSMYAEFFAHSPIAAQAAQWGLLSCSSDGETLDT